MWHKSWRIVKAASKSSIEPILWLTQLRWSFASSDNPVNLRPSLDRKPSQYSFHDFHYDAHDFKSVTAFVYLTDVNLDSGPHMIIPGSHKNKTLKYLAHICFEDHVAHEIYRDKIRAILGNKGLVFFEDTSCYHKAAVCNKERRLLLSIHYVLRHKIPPERPLFMNHEASISYSI
jgi:ectoine hydroxylase-related dioxygenase (phytanoyl-CoA dioxygenase family)